VSLKENLESFMRQLGYNQNDLGDGRKHTGVIAEKDLKLVQALEREELKYLKSNPTGDIQEQGVLLLKLCEQRKTQLSNLMELLTTPDKLLSTMVQNPEEQKNFEGIQRKLKQNFGEIEQVLGKLFEIL